MASHPPEGRASDKCSSCRQLQLSEYGGSKRDIMEKMLMPKAEWDHEYEINGRAPWISGRVISE